MYYLGIDLGTSSVKLLLCDEKLNILSSHSEDYPIFYPQDGWSEQNPEDWWSATKKGIKKIGESHDLAQVQALSFGGQMHGLVALDSDNDVIRRAILWNDGRTGKQVEYLNQTVGTEFLIQETGNIAYAGFTAPKILWLRDNEPENFDKIKHILLPKDYLTFCFTGQYATDYSDASGMLLLDVKNRRWSKKMLDICGIDNSVMPKLFESYEVVGAVLPTVAKELGLSSNCVVTAGAGDNAAAAIGTGTLGNGRCNLSLGTSGTIFISSDHYIPMEHSELHSFCHADGNYHVMGCILTAASANRWWIEDILKSDDYNQDAAIIEVEQEERLGENNVFFMPYMMGERSPLNDEHVRGAFIGLSMNTDRISLQQAIFEGVSFALRDCLEAAKDRGLNIHATTITGGGAKSEIWKVILADILNLDIIEPIIEEGPSLGAVLLAMWGADKIKGYKDILDLTQSANYSSHQVISPNPERVKYENKYRQFRSLILL